MRINQLLKTRRLNLKSIYFFGFLLLSILGSVSSCTKNETITCPNDDTTISDDITFRDGRLIFKDNTSFRNHEKWLLDNEDKPRLITDKNKSLGFKSMTEYYLDGMKLDQNDPMFVKYVASYPTVFNEATIDSSTIYFLPHSIMLCYVANKDGIYQIGKEVFRLVQNYIYRTDESKIDKLFLPKNQIPAEDVKIMLSNPKLETKVNDYAQKTVYFNNNNNFRIISTLREYIAVDQFNNQHWINEIWTTPQHKVVFWGLAQLNTKAANGYGYYQESCPGCPQIPLYPGSLENTGQSGHTLFAGYSYDLLFNYSYVPAYSRGRLIDGPTEFIYIKWTDAFAVPAVNTITHTPVLSDPY
jgi:hypothetical protein